MLCFAAMAKTGNMERARIPIRIPVRISSMDKVSVSKYFSINSSEPSAAFSINERCNLSALPFSEAGISRISTVPPPLGNFSSFIRIKSMMLSNPAPELTGYCAIVTFSPK